MGKEYETMLEQLQKSLQNDKEQRDELIKKIKVDFVTLLHWVVALKGGIHRLLRMLLILIRMLTQELNCHPYRGLSSSKSMAIFGP